MDVPTTHIEVKHTALGYKVIKLLGPTKSEWELFFNNPKKVMMFLSSNSTYSLMTLLSGILIINTGKERFSIFPDSTLDNEEYNTIINILPTITKNAIKLKSIGNS